MKCPKCGNELTEGKLLCEHCGEEVNMVPDFDIELEAELHKNISSMMEDISLHTKEDTKEEYIEEFPENEEELKEDFRDYFPRGRKVLPLFAVAVGAVILLAAAAFTIRLSQKNSYGYQYNKAIECAAQDHYDEAVVYLEKALALNPSDTGARFLLAKYYDKSGQSQSAVLVLEELLKLETGREEEIYDLLLKILENRQDYRKMGEWLKECRIERIVSKYNKYAALAPSFNKEEGVYEELISVTLKGIRRALSIIRWTVRRRQKIPWCMNRRFLWIPAITR